MPRTTIVISEKSMAMLKTMTRHMGLTQKELWEKLIEAYFELDSIAEICERLLEERTAKMQNAITTAIAALEKAREM